MKRKATNILLSIVFVLSTLTLTGMDSFVFNRVVNAARINRRSIATQDGWLLESGETTNRGGGLNKTTSTIRLGDNARKKQYRSILSFSTKSLPDNAVITKVTLKVKKQGTAGGGNPINIFRGIMVDVRKGFFGSSVGLQIGDFQASRNKSLGPFKPALVNGWYTINLTPAKAYINKLATKGGVTQLRLRFKLDDNNNAVANYLKLYSGNAPVASRPQLIIEYSVPTSSTYFPVGMGGSDVIPHQIVRTNTDRLYIFANQQSSATIRVYRAKRTGLPEVTSDFAAPVQFAESSNPISVDAVYDGGKIIHMLINTRDGHIKDYPFDTVKNVFKAPIFLAGDAGTVSSDLYVGTSGVSGMVDKSGKLHVTYWTNENHILHRSYTYNSASNVLNPASNFFQVDTAGSANHPAVAVSPVNNSLTVAWVSEADTPPKIRTRTRTSAGSWGAVKSASTAPVWTSDGNGINIDQGPSLIIDPSGKMHLTYIESAGPLVGDYGRVHYVTSSGSGWVDKALNAYSHDPALAVNSAGKVFIIGHGHPQNPSCQSMSEICVVKKKVDGTWTNPQVFAVPPSGYSFDSSPSVKWSTVGFNRPGTIEFVFFMTPYHMPTLYYARFKN